MASQGSRALALCSYFLSGCLAINASQFLATPLYLIDKNWYDSWIVFTKQSFGLLTMTLTQAWAPTVVRVSGGKSVRGQLLKTVEGNLCCNFPDRLVLMANHQIYTDWLYMWWIAYANGMHGRIHIVLKESLRYIPIIGWGMQLSQFIFLKRDWEKDKESMATHLQKLNVKSKPMWLMIFPEGTNLAPSTREASQKWAMKNGFDDMRHGLVPRTTGLQFCLKQLSETTEYLYDCTIAYEGVKQGQYAQDIFTLNAAYFQGRPPKSVNMYWRRFKVSSIPLHDPVAFEKWLRNRWIEKDKLIDMYLRTGRFPADTGVDKDPKGQKRRGAGYIEAEIKAFHWYEFLQVFAPVGVLAMILFMFYGSLPMKLFRAIDKQTLIDNLRSFAQGKALDGVQRKALTAPGETTKSVSRQLIANSDIKTPGTTNRLRLPAISPNHVHAPPRTMPKKLDKVISTTNDKTRNEGSKPPKLNKRDDKAKEKLNMHNTKVKTGVSKPTSGLNTKKISHASAYSKADPGAASKRPPKLPS